MRIDLQRDRRSVSGAEQNDSGVEGTPTQRFPADLFAGGQHVPTVARVNLCKAAAGCRFWAHGFLSAHRSSVSRGERHRETQTIMYSFEACSSSLSTESR